MVKLRLFGSPSITPGHLQQPKILALLALLVTEPGRKQDRARVAEQLWPDSSGDKARLSLRQVLYRLRSGLPTHASGDPVPTDRQFFCLNPDYPLASDVASFLDAVEAGPEADEDHLWAGLRAYAGPFLDGLDLDEQSLFNGWIRERRARFREQARDLASRLADRYLAAGDPERALQAVSHFTAREPEDDAGRHLRDQVLERTRMRAPEEGETASGGEQRLLTVLYCEPPLSLEGSPEARLDGVITQRGRIRDRLEEWGARVEAGPDGALVGYFGLPSQAEGAAARACGAALVLVAESMPIGLHSGWSLTGQQGHPDFLGEIVRGARDAAWAGSGGAPRVSPALARRLPEGFEVQTDPAEGGEGYGWLRAASGEGDLTELVGRRRERAYLLNCARRLRHGSGGVVVVTGEPGVGKTRLLRAWEESLSGRIPSLHVQALAANANAPFAPFAHLLRERAGWNPGQTTEDQRRRVADYLEQLPGLTQDSRQALQGLFETGQEAGESLHLTRAWEDLFREWAQQPLAVVFEDWHWADAASRNLLDGLARLAQELPLLLVVSARPGGKLPDWGGQARLDLAPLGAEESQRLAFWMGHSLGLVPEMSAAVARASGGVPLYAEELARSWAAGGGTGEAGLPSLPELVLQRLDALGAAKRAAQLGSLVGRGFTTALLAGLEGRAESAVQSEIQALEEAALVRCYRTSQGEYFQFRHDLVEGIVYDTLPAGERATLHGRLARLIETDYPSQRDMRPEWLAGHYERAGEYAPAAHLYLRAASRSAFLGAHDQAREHLDRASRQIGGMPAGDERAALQQEVGRFRVAQSLFLEGWSANDETVTEEGGDFDSLFTQILGDVPEGNWAELTARARRLLAMAREEGDRDRIRTARHILGFCANYAGDFLLADQHLHDVLPEADEEAPEWLVRLYSGPPKPVELAYRALLSQWRGRDQEAEWAVEEALKRTRRYGSPNLSGYVLTLATAFYRHARRPRPALALAEETRQLGREERVRSARLGGLGYREWAKAALGRQANPDRLQAVARGEGGNSGGFMLAVMAAPIYGLQGRWAEQIRLLQWLLGEPEGVRVPEGSRGELFTELGEAQLAIGAWAEGENSLHQALELAGAGGDRRRRLRAALALARHWLNGGEPGRAVAVLDEALADLPPEADNPDSDRARRLLNYARGSVRGAVG